MYYEECIKDGVLCYRTTPDGEWVQKTQEQLTEMLMEARRVQRPITFGGVATPAVVYHPVFIQ